MATTTAARVADDNDVIFNAVLGLHYALNVNLLHQFGQDLLSRR